MHAGCSQTSNTGDDSTATQIGLSPAGNHSTPQTFAGTTSDASSSVDPGGGGGWHHTGSLAQQPQTASGPGPPQPQTPDSAEGRSRDDSREEKLPYAPDLPSTFPCHAKGGFRQAMGIDTTMPAGRPQNSSGSASPGVKGGGSLQAEFECNSTHMPLTRNLLEEANSNGLIVCCYEEGMQRPPDEECSQKMMICSARGFNGSTPPRVDCSASGSGPIGVDTAGTCNRLVLLFLFQAIYST